MDVLFQPVCIGSLELKNRLVMPAMHLGYCDNGLVTGRLVDFYRERALGGVGLIVVGGCAIDDHGYNTMIKISSDDYITGLTGLVEVVHSGGAAIAAQLFQPGRYSYSFNSGIQPVAPSAVPSKLTGQMPRELGLNEIYQIIDSFAAAAGRAKQAGFDAVEVIGSAGYLVAQFLSPVTNQRDDEFGGDFQRRMRFGLEVAARIKQVCGQDFPLMFRITGNEFMPGGNTNDEMAVFCRELEQAGVDAINVTGGWHETRVPQITMGVPRGGFAYLARGIKEAVDIPVMACNRINDPWLAAELINDGVADLVGVARGMIADPEFVNKVKDGLAEDIRPCIGCNQGCLDAIFSGGSVACLVNARAGKEARHKLVPTVQPKRVLVVGGGPAGLEAARVCAERGHQVTVWERELELGGQLNLAAVPPGRYEFLSFIDYLTARLATLNVDLEVGHEATAEEVLDFGADAVIMATGASPLTPPIPGVEGDHVVQAWDVLSGIETVGKKVVIIGGGAVGCETALYLGQKGTIDPETFHFLAVNGAETWEKLMFLATRGIKDITVVEMQKALGADIGMSTRWTILQEMKRYGIKSVTGVTALRINNQGVLIKRGDQEELLTADTVVLAAGSRPDSELCEQIKEKVKEVYLIGDAVMPRKALDAVHQGYLAGAML